jgi:hypothetical protein
MTERPILFSAPMVRAILAGTKSQTRRAIKRKASDVTDAYRHHALCPYGQPGDRLYVRETWMDLLGTGIEGRDPATGKPTRYAYAADTPAGSYGDQCRKDYGLKWKPSIHMPRVASRILLEVVGVRVERVQSINADDAMAEGIVRMADGGYASGKDGAHYHAASAWHSYASLWEAINGPGSWEANPWVWVVEFRRTSSAAASGVRATDGGQQNG